MGRIRRIGISSFVVFALLALVAPELMASGKKSSKQDVHTVTASKVSESIQLFKDATFLLPNNIHLSTHWVIPPTDAKWFAEMFSIDGAGSAVFGHHADSSFYLIKPEQKYVVSVGTEISNFTHLENGVLVLASANSLGILAKPKEKSVNEQKIPLIGFQPIADLPLNSIDLLTAVGNTPYCAGLNPKTNLYSLYALRSLNKGGINDLELLYESKEPITAVTANDDFIYVATGKNLFQIHRADAQLTPLYAHPTNAIIDLVATKEGIIVGTEKELVFVGTHGAIEIMRSGGHRILMSHNSLYVLFKKSLGVLAIGNLSELEHLNQEFRPASPKDISATLSVASVSFFENGAPPYVKKVFSNTFESESIRRIVAQIDLKAPVASKKPKQHTLTVSWYEPTGGQLLSRSYPVSLKAGVTTEQIFLSIGQESDITGYIPKTIGAYKFGKDALGLRYPGKYRVITQIDGIPAGEWSFVISGKNTFEQAVFYDDLAMMKTILSQLTPTKYITSDGTPFLDLAIKFGSVEAVKILLSMGANPNIANKERQTPLALCLDYAPECEKEMELLIKYGANVNQLSGPDQTPLLQLCTSRHDVTTFLLKHGADIHAKDKVWKLSFADTIAFQYHNGCSDELLGEMIRQGVDLNAINKQHPYESMLGSAIDASDTECVKNLLKRGVSSLVVKKNATEPERSALYVALQRLYSNPREYGRKLSLQEIQKSRQIVQLLLESGAKLKPGKKRLTSKYFETLENLGRNSLNTEAYTRFNNEDKLVRSGEGCMMFLGEGPSFFTKAEMKDMLKADDTALSAASTSKDETIREMVLQTHLDRVEELLASAKSDSYLNDAHDHCDEASKIAEKHYKAMQVTLIPAQEVKKKDIIMLNRTEGGAYVQQLTPESPYARAGLLPGDIILAIDTQTMKNVDEISARLSKLTPGMPVQITFLRDVPLLHPELPLICGILESARNAKGLANMYLSQWLLHNQNSPERNKIEALLKP